MTHRFLSNSVLCTVQPDRTAITFFKLSDANPLGRELSLLLSMETSAPPISALIMTFSLPSQTLALALTMAIAVFECTLRLGSARPAFISFQALWRVYVSGDGRRLIPENGHWEGGGMSSPGSADASVTWRKAFLGRQRCSRGLCVDGEIVVSHDVIAGE